MLLTVQIDIQSDLAFIQEENWLPIPTLAGEVASPKEDSASFAEERFHHGHDPYNESYIVDAEERTLHDKLAVYRRQKLEFESHWQLLEYFLVRLQPLIGQFCGGVFQGFGQTIMQSLVNVEFLTKFLETL